ncbi:MAG: ATP-binding protein [Acidobacteriota bacterium]
MDDRLEESMDELYEEAPCGYISALPEGTIIKVNRTFLTWTGYDRDDLVGLRRFQDLLAPGGRIFHETHYAPLLRMQGSVREIALDVMCADGRRLPVLVNSVLKTDGGGAPRLVRTTVFNATHRKEYERELLRERQRAEEASRAKGDFISMVSHEIRTPLNAILGVAHLFGATELSEHQQKLVRILRSSSEGLLHLINDILDLSRIQSGKLTLEEKALDLRQVIEDVVSGQRVKAEEKGLVLETSLDGRMPDHLLGDPVKIGQVLTNLVGNAVKFTSRGSVRLDLRVLEGTPETVTVEIRVTDTGIGIEKDRLPLIFDDFTQASYEIGRKYGGTGLGLSISRKLVEMHGSRLEVESEPGRGSSFFFTLRLKVAQPAAPAVREEDGGKQVLQGLRVLVVDDNAINVFVLTAFLEHWGVELDVMGNGREALEAVQGKQRPYDLVLMDLRMPEMDGYEAARRMRADFPRLPIFALSASTRIGNQHELEAAGFTEFVGKPINPDTLLAKILAHARPAADPSE